MARYHYEFSSGDFSRSGVSSHLWPVEPDAEPWFCQRCGIASPRSSAPTRAMPLIGETGRSEVDDSCARQGCANPRSPKAGFGLCLAHYREDKALRAAVCKQPGCEKSTVARGWCTAHYERWRKHGDPTVDMRQRPARVCSEEGCFGKTVGRGFCSKHYARFMRLGSTELPIGVTRETQICLADDCERSANGGRGYCTKHYHRIRKYGSTHEDRRATGSPICAVADCEATAIARGYCVKHYQRYMKHGDPGTVKPCRICGNTETVQRASWCLPCIESIFLDADFHMLGEFVDRMTGVVCECLVCGRRSTPCLMNVRKGSGCIEVISVK